MSFWPSKRARLLLAALKKIGWEEKRQTHGSHKILAREGWTNYTFAFHDGEEIGPKMMAKVARQTGLSPDDL